MKVFLVLVLSVFLFQVVSIADDIKNADQPLNGEWNFDSKLVWQLSEAGNDPIVDINKILVDEDGTVFTFDKKHFKFFVFGADGKLRHSFGSRGEGPKEIKQVLNFFLIDKYIVVHDMGKIHYFMKNGTFHKTVPVGSGIGGMFGETPQAFLDAEHFLTIPKELMNSSSSQKIQIYNVKNGESKTLTTIDAQSDTAVKKGGVQVVMISRNSPAKADFILTVDKGKIYFGKTDLYRVAIMDLQGNKKLTFSIEGRERKKVPQSYVDKMMRKITRGASAQGHVLPDAILERVKKSIPDRSNYFSEIHIDKNGMIYVLLVDMANEAQQEIDVFSPGGKYLYHGIIKVPGNNSIKNKSFLLHGNNYYCFCEDKDGEVKLLKCSIRLPKLN